VAAPAINAGGRRVLADQLEKRFRPSTGGTDAAAVAGSALGGCGTRNQIGAGGWSGDRPDASDRRMVLAL